MSRNRRLFHNISSHSFSIPTTLINFQSREFSSLFTAPSSSSSSSSSSASDKPKHIASDPREKYKSTEVSSQSRARSTFHVTYRDYKQSGSLKSRKMRKDGRVPGVLYGLDQDGNELKVTISMEAKFLNAELRKHASSFENTLYDIKVTPHIEDTAGEVNSNISNSNSSSNISRNNSNGKEIIMTVIPRQVQVNPITDLPISCNFLRYIPGKNRVRIPIELINAEQSVDLKRGCFLVHSNRYLECVCSEDVKVRERE